MDERPQRRLVRAAARVLTSHQDRERAHAIDLGDALHGYDEFGANTDWIGLGIGLFRGLYGTWFRVDSFGIENIPPSGAAILASNHSGTVPLDAIMIWTDVVKNTLPPRLPRPVVDHFVPNLPFVSTLFARGGAVGGSRGNVNKLLARGELLLVFPEGTPGIGKPFQDRYKLQAWREGHVELALEHKAPVIPMCVIGAEEQLPQIARIEVRLFGAPYLPVPASPIPLPVHYRIYYGDPIRLHEELGSNDWTDPRVLRVASDRVRGAVEALISRGLRERQGVFR